MRILILSSTPFSKNNSFGNSYSNIFEGIKNPYKSIGEIIESV